MTTSSGLEASLQRIHSLNTRDLDVVIVVTQPGALGGTPSVPLLSVDAGIDWNAGKLMLTPAQPLSPLSAEEKLALVESVRKGQSWHAYQQYKRLTGRIAALEAQLRSNGIEPVPASQDANPS